MSLSLLPPPRKIPLSLQIGLIFGQAKTLPAGIFLGISLLIVWIFALHPIQQDLMFNGPTQSVMGTLSMVEQATGTQTSSNFRRGLSVPVYACQFNFNYQGRTLSAVSYFSSFQAPLAGVKQVPVEFLAGKPEVARINLPGYRITLLDGWLFFSSLLTLPFLLLPLLGLAQWGWGLIRGYSLLRLLRQGQMTQGRLIRQEQTTRQIIVKQERLHIFKLIFTYQVAGKIYEILLKTHEVAKLTDEARENILYLPARPEQARLLDSLPASVLLKDGTFESTHPRQSLAHLILPLLLLAECVYFLTQ